MIVKEITVVASTYTNRDGQEKKRWVTIGHIHKTGDGTREYITLDPMVNLAAIPRKEGDDRIYANLFDPKPKNQGAAPAAPAQGAGFIDDDIGF